MLYILGISDDEDGNTRAARDENGKTVYVPAKLTYEEWRQKYVNAEHEPEQERYGRNKSTQINKSYIAGGEFDRKFNAITDNDKVNRTLRSVAKDMLRHRSGTLYEDMYWIDGSTGRIVHKITDMKTEERIVYNKTTMKVIEKHDNLITIHNHPMSFPPSSNDVYSGAKNGYALGLVVGHDGTVYKYRAKTSHITEPIIQMAIDKYKKMGYSLHRAHVMALHDLDGKGLIDFEEVE